MRPIDYFEALRSHRYFFNLERLQPFGLDEKQEEENETPNFVFFCFLYMALDSGEDVGTEKEFEI